MNIKDLHPKEKSLSASSIFKSELGNASAIQLLTGGKLDEHTTKTPALLICISGEAIFENEKGVKETLSTGDYIQIEPKIKHWVTGIADSQLLLVK